jgi:hypothetical protein
MPLLGGWIVFDPERYWVIRECHVDLRPHRDDPLSTLDGTFEYKESRKGFPIPKRIVRKWPHATYLQEFDLMEQADLQDKEFTLSAFGLPEPAEMEGRSPTRWYLWAAVAGMVCLALGVTFRWRSKQRAA